MAYDGDFRFLQLAFGYLLGRVVVATVLLPAYFRGRDLHRLSVAAGPVRRPDPDDGLAPVPRGPLARRRPPALPRRDGARAPDRLAARGGHRGRGDDHRRLHLPGRWRYMEKQKIAIALSILLVIISTLLNLLVPYMIGVTIDDYIIPKDMDGTLRFLVMVAIVYLAAACLLGYRTF